MKELNEDGREVVDGRVVDLYEMRFTGGVTLEPEDAASISAGDLITCIITARVGPPKMAEVKKTDEYKRINSSKLESLSILDADLAKKFYDEIGVFVYGVNDGLVEITYSKDEKAEESEGAQVFTLPDLNYG